MVSHLLNDIQTFEEELMREEYFHSAGIRDNLNTAAIFEKYPHLFSKENIAEAKALLEQADSVLDKRKAKLMFSWLVSGFIGNEVKQIGDEVASVEANATVDVNGKPVAYRQVATLMMNEDSRDKRRAMYVAMAPVKERLTGYDRKLWDESYRLVRELTGKEYVDFCTFENEVDYDALANQLREFLVKTDKIYTDVMAEQFAKLDVSLDDAHPWDFAYLARAKQFDEYFKKEKLLPTVEKFWAGLGFDISGQKNVVLDIEEREKKVPRAFCMPVRVPEEVVLVIKPRGGQDDFQAFLHESGHTEHFANTRADLPYALKHMGAHSVSESYAFLCEYMMAKPDWLKEYVGMPDAAAKEFAKFLMEHKLYFFRRYSAKVLYELKLHRNNLQRLDGEFRPTDGNYKDAAEMYVDILTKATKIKYRRENYLRDVDAGLYAADYVRAWLFEVMLRRKLEEKFGSEWYKSADAGGFLKSLWQWGSSGKSLEELAGMLGYEGVDIKYITDDFVSFFS